MRRHLRRRLAALAVAIVLVGAACGSASTEDDITGGAETSPVPEDSETTPSTTSEVSTTTTAAPTTTTPSTTTTPTTSKAAPPIEERLAGGLLTLDDLPTTYAVEFENGMMLDGSDLGNLPLAPCGVDLEEATASDARQSFFADDLTVEGWPGDGAFSQVLSAVRMIGPDAESVVGLVGPPAEACTGSQFETENGLAMTIGLDVEEVDGVIGSGWASVSSEEEFVGYSSFYYVFEIGPLDAYLFLVGVGPDVRVLPDLATPIVEAFQRNLADCVSDVEVCAFVD